MGQNGWISTKMCSVEWKVWMWMWKMSWCGKMSCYLNTIGPFTLALSPQKADMKTKRMLFWLVQTGGYRRRCALLSGRCGCEGKRWVAAAKRAVTQKLLGRLAQFTFSLTVGVKIKSMLFWSVKTGRYCWRCALLSGRCGCECERWVDAAKQAVTQKLLNLYLDSFFPEADVRQRKCCIDWSKQVDITEDVLCGVEGVGVNVKDELMQ